MHHPRSIATVIRLRLSAFLLLAISLLAIVAAALLTHSIVVHDTSLITVGASIAGSCMLLLIIQWAVASSVGCPLCRTAVLAPKSCMKHRRARTLLGSHRLRVAMSILLKNRFRCPYCNEYTALKIRETITRTGIRRSLRE
jgi:hypothetical protein